MRVRKFKVGERVVAMGDKALGIYRSTESEDDLFQVKVEKDFTVTDSRGSDFNFEVCSELNISTNDEESSWINADDLERYIKVLKTALTQLRKYGAEK